MFAAAIAPRGMPNDGVLGQPHANIMAKGILAGASLLRQYLQDKARKGPLPLGLDMRLNLLQWDDAFTDTRWAAAFRPKLPTQPQASSSAVPILSTATLTMTQPSSSWNKVTPGAATDISPPSSPPASPMRPRANRGAPLPAKK